ncbi:MAG: hypothetical protein ACXVZ2_12310 [Gaiellaceae bacterium]
MDEPRIAVLGPTDFTGRLVVAEARAAGAPLRLVGRRREALQELALPGDEIRVVDAAAPGDAFTSCTAVVSCAGPFLRIGAAPVAAAVASGADYLDSSGEQAWARLLFEQFRAAETAVLPCSGFDYVPGDVAARLAAEGLEPLDEIVVAYSASAAATSRGTRRTVGEILAQPVVAWHEGRLVESGIGGTTRTVVFPFGAREVVEFGGAEPLTVPRHTDVRSVRSYMRLAKPAVTAARAARFLAPVIRMSAALRGIGPDDRKRAATRFVVVAEARGPTGGRRVTLAGSDPYLLTAQLLVAGARLEPRRTGPLAPAEAFDARALIDAAGGLLRVESVEAL